MKHKKVFFIMIIIVLLLIIAILLHLKNPIAETIKEETYSKETTYIINDKEYSTTLETFNILKNEVTYTKTYNYKDKETIKYKEQAIIEYDEFNINNHTYYIINNKVCIDKSCSSFYAPYIEKETKDLTIKTKDYLKDVYTLKKYYNDSLSIFYIYDTSYIDLTNIIKDYNITIYTVNINNISNKIIEEHNLVPNKIFIFQKEELIAEINPSNLHEYLFHLGIESR